MYDRYAEIDGVIAWIHDSLYDPLPLARLAKLAGYSPYHFTRIFKERTGLTPMYYVSSLRLQKAKHLLLRTNLNVRDIGLEIGQQSLGTFTTRFTERVGVTPTEFRNSARRADLDLRSLQRLGDWREPHVVRSCTCLEGNVRAEEPFEGVVLIGLFARPIPEGMPLYGTLVALPRDGAYRIPNVKPGAYYVLATSVGWGTGAADMLLPQKTLRTRDRTPLVVGAAAELRRDVELYPPRLDDPPILISLPLLMQTFLGRVLRPPRPLR